MGIGNLSKSQDVFASLKLMGNKENGYTRNTYGFKIVMKYYMFFTVLLTISSCNYKKKKMTLISNRHNTTIIYDIDNLSSEGAEARVLYRDGKIKESTIEKISNLTEKETIEYIEDIEDIEEKENNIFFKGCMCGMLVAFAIMLFMMNFLKEMI